MPFKYQTTEATLNRLGKIARIIQLCQIKLDCLEKSCTSSIYTFAQKQQLRREVEKRRQAVANLQKHYAVRVFAYAAEVYDMTI